MTTPSPISPAPANAEDRPRLGWTRLAQAAAAIVLITLAGVYGLAWWDERPLRQAEAEVARKEYRPALTTLQKYLSTHPGDTRALALKGRCLVGLKRWDEALRIFDAVEAATFEDLYAWAQTVLAAQQWSKAELLLKQARNLRPNDPDVLEQLTGCRSLLGRYADATESATELARIPGREARAYLQLATIEQDLSNWHKATEYWKLMLEASPEAKNLQAPPHEIFLEYGIALSNDSQLEAARTWIERSLNLKETAEGRFRLGKVAAELQELPAAITAWKRVLELEPNHREAREMLANEALQRKASKEALEWLEPLADRDDLSSSTAFLFQRAHDLQQDGAAAATWRERATQLRKREKLDATIRQALQEAPDAYWSRVLRAYRFAERGNGVEATVLLGELIRDNPEAAKEAFVHELFEAIEKGSALPALERLPIKLY